MNISYWHFISHLLPGFLVVSQGILIAANYGKIDLQSLLDVALIEFTIIALLSLPIGLFIDAIHHRLIAKIYKRLCHVTNDKNEFYYLPLIGHENFKRFYDSFYPASEGYTNLATSIIILPAVVATSSLPICIKTLLIIVSIFLIIFFYYNGFVARSRHEKGFQELIIGLEDHRKR